ncbi:1-cys-glutaredoxin-like protein-1 [Plasmodium brasilianum]|uniref:1-cys-glutaredoxin-like protein-1 (GLP1) n=2 Tax=Plasmodium (Plasmodium) TaxID=418103 RepID=A0A1A8WMU6_PLAMA|nr:1-cys-glutaredoxin-like protein-1, putative [Plasmodium malariae]KAI4839034.1 1-cys-glutaredoxin-like protein-1 [Plasmodium brasilianum]SBS94234.1 1-cys-glutaredoxin-like protein-1 (GLP1) [Plasmodium malariae]SCN12387.1 1-cys-glutaredoxin-like protein-1, putative [Plasmodium malariae]
MIVKNRFGIFFLLRKNIICSRNTNFFSFIRVSKINFSNSFQDKKNGISEQQTNNSTDQFKDFEKTDVYQTLKVKIKEVLEQEKIVLFMKGTPEKPLCGFSANVVRILNSMNVKDYIYIDVMKNNNLREAIKIYSNWPYIPHLYINNNFIGGYDIIADLYNKGELADIIK